VGGLFDDGAMVNSICKDMFALAKSALGKLATSEKLLCMADSTIVPSYRQWSGGVTLGGQTTKASFEVFPSGGSWLLLFGRPLLQAFKTIHNYEDDTLRIPCNEDWMVPMNKYMKPTITEGASVLKGDVKSSMRQVLTSILTYIEHVDKQSLLEKLIATEPTYTVIHRPKRQG
jgi:hypothetical protein